MPSKRSVYNGRRQKIFQEGETAFSVSEKGQNPYFCNLDGENREITIAPSFDEHAVS